MGNRGCCTKDAANPTGHAVDNNRIVDSILVTQYTEMANKRLARHKLKDQARKPVEQAFKTELELQRINRHSVIKLSDVSQEVTQAALQAQKTICRMVLRGDVQEPADNFGHNSPASSTTTRAETDDGRRCSNLAQACWAHYVKSEDNTVCEILDDFDCMSINSTLVEMQVDPMCNHILQFPLMKIDLQKMTVIKHNQPKQPLQLVRSYRCQNRRRADSFKTDGALFHPQPSTSHTKLALKWISKNQNAFPSICDVVTGLKTLFETIVDKKMRGQKAQRIAEVKEQYSAKVFSRLFDLCGIARPFEPLTP